MAEPAAAGRIRVTVMWSPAPRQVVERQLDLPEGSTAQAALEGLGDWPGPAELGIWGRRVQASQRLEDGDRLELYRPLKADPKTARRERFSRQGARATGLFARRRPGAKPGY